MKLSAEEIDFIETALIEKCNFKDFDDVRMELTDHIATEIEAEMENSKALFDVAFVKVMSRWNPMILPKSWSRYENVPYMVCKLWKSLDWKFQFSAIPITLMVSLVAYYGQQNGISLYVFLLPILVLGVLANIYLLMRKYNNRVKSTLSSYALQKIFGQTLTLLAFLIINAFFISEGILDTILPMFWPSTYVSLLMLGKAWVMKKHIKIENQLLKVI